jgi:cell division protein FtsB
MRDIGARIQRYRLSRYGHAGGATFRWLWPLLLLWLFYAALLGEHSWLRIRRMGSDERRAQADLAATRAELAQAEHRLRDKSAQRDVGEHTLRERNGFVGRGEIIYRIPPPDSSGD